MILGQFHDRFPRVILRRPGQDRIFSIEFIVDTGFDGALTLPLRLLQQRDAYPFSQRDHLLADGSLRLALVYRMMLLWNGEPREVEVLVLEGNPLLGTLLLDGCPLDTEAVEGGEVLIEPLA